MQHNADIHKRKINARLWGGTEMDDILARPMMLKQVNLSSIRKVIRSNKVVTRAEIAWETKISSTTVRSLLNEMSKSGEIEGVGFAESSGGRKAEKYRFNLDRYFSIAFCIMGNIVHYIIVNIIEEIVETGELGEFCNKTMEPIVSFLDKKTKEKTIKSIGIGVPGIVDGGTYWCGSSGDTLEQIDIGTFLTNKYEIPVVLENDLNAIATGFCRRYENNNSGSDSENNTSNSNMAFMYFGGAGISAGFIVGGKVVRGFNNFAGELSMATLGRYGEKFELNPGKMSDAEFTEYVIKVTCWICAVLNPQYITLAGDVFREKCLPAINDGIKEALPMKMQAELLFSSDDKQDYFEGLAYLAAGRIFDEVQLLKG